MAHYACTHKETGQVRFSTDRHLDPAKWDVVRLRRAPGLHDEFVGGKLVTNRERHAHAQKHEHAARLTRAELVDRLIALEARLEKLELAKPPV